MEEEEGAVRSFLRAFVEEFPSALDEAAPLPGSPLSRTVTTEELPGESLELGGRLLSARAAPAGFSALLCQAALSQLLQDDLSPFHCPDQEEGEPALLQSEGVQRLFLNKLIGVALGWHQKAPEELQGPCSLPLCSVHAIRNTRRKMEDKHLALAHFNQLFGIKDEVRCAYYAVFDGHGGVDAATYAATHLHVALSKQEALRSHPGTALQAAFTHTDHMFRGKAKRERLRSGSTGVVVLIQGQELTVAWLGDSQAMLVRQGEAVTLMDPHKPDREDEKQRIEDLGGCVTFMGCWRVNGTYAVSRAIGDFDQKPYVSGEADCSTVPLSGDEDYVLLACDGFFDTVTPAEVPALVLEALRQPAPPGPAPEGPQETEEKEADRGQRVAQALVAHAKAAGSSDNITVMLVFLRPPEQLLLLAAAAQ